MGFSESLDALKAMDTTGEHIEQIIAHVDSLKAESISHRKKYSDEATKFSAFSQKLSEAGLDTNADIVEQITALKGAGKQTTDEASRKIAAVEKQLAEMRAEKEALAQKALRKAAEASFTSAISENFYNGNVMLRALLADGVIGIDADDKPFVKIGEEYLEPNAGIAKLRELPEFRDGAKNRQAAGAGTRDGGTNGGKTMSLENFEKLSAKARAAFMADGGKIS